MVPRTRVSSLESELMPVENPLIQKKRTQLKDVWTGALAALSFRSFLPASLPSAESILSYATHSANHQLRSDDALHCTPSHRS